MNDSGNWVLAAVLAGMFGAFLYGGGATAVGVLLLDVALVALLVAAVVFGVRVGRRQP